MNTTALIISNLSHSINTASIMQIFEMYGPCNVKFTGENAIVDYASELHAKSAMSFLNYTNLFGLNNDIITIQIYVPPLSTPIQNSMISNKQSSNNFIVSGSLPHFANNAIATNVFNHGISNNVNDDKNKPANSINSKSNNILSNNGFASVNMNSNQMLNNNTNPTIGQTTNQIIPQPNNQLISQFMNQSLSQSGNYEVNLMNNAKNKKINNISEQFSPHSETSINNQKVIQMSNTMGNMINNHLAPNQSIPNLIGNPSVSNQQGNNIISMNSINIQSNFDGTAKVTPLQKIKMNSSYSILNTINTSNNQQNDILENISNATNIENSNQIRESKNVSGNNLANPVNET